MIAIGNRREVFFDDFLVNEAASTAGAMLHKPIRRGVALAFDKPWEGNVCGYPLGKKDVGIPAYPALPRHIQRKRDLAPCRTVQKAGCGACLLIDKKAVKKHLSAIS